MILLMANQLVKDDLRVQILTSNDFLLGQLREMIEKYVDADKVSIGTTIVKSNLADTVFLIDEADEWIGKNVVRYGGKEYDLEGFPLLKQANRTVFLTGTVTPFLTNMVNVLEGKEKVLTMEFLSKSEISVGQD